MLARSWVTVSSRVSVVVAALAACNKNYCEDHPYDNCRLMWDAAGTGCTSNAACEVPTAVCDVDGTKTCVQCIAPDQASACTGTTPVCGADHMCRACAAH